MNGYSLNNLAFVRFNVPHTCCLHSYLGYWIELLGTPPDFFIEEIDNSDLPGIPTQRQWLGILNENSKVTMLNSDISLVRDVPDMESGISCSFSGPDACSHDTPFMYVTAW